MQKLLRNVYWVKNFTATLLILLSMASLCYGQIELSDNTPQEFRFTLNQNQASTGGSYTTIAFTELIRNSIHDEQFDVIEYSENIPDNSHYYYIPDAMQYISAGRVQSGDTDEATFINLSIQNDSPYHFGGTVLSFDFVYNISRFQDQYNLTLQYRVNNALWRNVSGSTLSTATFSDNGEEWDTFSVQLNLDQIYLRNGDELGLRWVFNNRRADEIEPAIPIGLQRLEVSPERALEETIEEGSVIITEIFPKSSTDGVEFEYIELFNTTESPISLKGVELNSSTGTVVVQQEIELPPYGTVIFSNIDMSGFESVQTSYIYQEPTLLPASGRVEISRDNQLIARAIYESREEGIALELDRMVHAINSYTSLQNLIPSESVFYSDIKGTPGEIGNTIPFYTRTITRDGWYLMSLPGALPERLNRNTSLEYFDPDGSRLTLPQIEPYSTILVYKTGVQPVTLFVEEAPLTDSDGFMTVRDMDDRFRIASSKSPLTHHLWSVKREGERPISPIVQIWDDRNQRFSLQFSDQYTTENWSTFILNSDVSGRLEYSTAGITTTPVSLEGTLPIRLYEGSGNNRSFRDDVMIGFVDMPAQLSNERYDLPKMTGSFEDDHQLPVRSQLYLTTPESKYRTNSFIHLPFNTEGSNRLGVGFEPVAGSNGIATLEWDITDELPEEWTLKLEDTETGITVDMREVQNYRFRFAGDPEELDRNNQFSGLTVLNPNNRNRFVLLIEPFEALSEAEEEDVRPGSIELRQNYPNPFNPATNITFYLPEERSVRIGVYNIVGQQVSLLVDETLQSGEHSVVWDATNNPSGIYIVQMETGSRILTRKITLIK